VPCHGLERIPVIIDPRLNCTLVVTATSIAKLLGLKGDKQMREVEIALDLLNTTRQLIENKQGLEMLHYLVAMAIREAQDLRENIRSLPLPP
jgi:hypothetical protein